MQKRRQRMQAPPLPDTPTRPPSTAHAAPAEPDSAETGHRQLHAVEDAAPGTRRTARGRRVQRFWEFLEGGNPHTTFWLVLGSALALTAVGLIMVLSATAVENVTSELGPYGLFIRQLTWALIGLGGMLGVTFLPQRWLKTLAWPIMGIGVLGLAAVLTPLGYEVQGNRNWIQIGPINGQPSEVAKLALCLWAGVVLGRKGDKVRELWHTIIPVIFPGTFLILTFILVGRDLGTALIFGFLAATMLFIAGTRTRYFLMAGAAGLVGALALALMNANRMTRIQAWLGFGDACSRPEDLCYQSQHGLFALASGGFWGLGLGQSRQKWNYIPEAENDFIFTILGEELGLLGAITVLLLYGALALGMFRVASKADERWMKITTIGIMAWIIGQAFINLAMVTGLLPVIGVPLPFLSYGGSALTATLLAVGVVLNFAAGQRRPIRGERSASPAPRTRGARPEVTPGRTPAPGRMTGRTAGSTSGSATGTAPGSAGGTTGGTPPGSSGEATVVRLDGDP